MDGAKPFGVDSEEATLARTSPQRGALRLRECRTIRFSEVRAARRLVSEGIRNLIFISDVCHQGLTLMFSFSLLTTHPVLPSHTAPSAPP